MVLSQDSNPRDVNRKSDVLPIAPPCHSETGKGVEKSKTRREGRETGKERKERPLWNKFLVTALAESCCSTAVRSIRKCLWYANTGLVNVLRYSLSTVNRLVIKVNCASRAFLEVVRMVDVQVPATNLRRGDVETVHRCWMCFPEHSAAADVLVANTNCSTH